MTPFDPAARIGQILDRYQLEAVLGRGGFGTVYRARHTIMNRVVALKLLHAHPDLEQQKRFVREAQAMARLQHPSIVQVFDFGTTADGEMFLVMELLEGEELERRRLRSPLPPREAIQLMCEVLDALVVAHAAGVVHRDLKPANLFLTVGGVKILDFGISLVREGEGQRMTRAGLVMGTPLYMAPESFTGVRDVDERVDIYAVAAMLYELLSGRTVFAAESYEELVVKVATETPTPMAQVAPGAPLELAAVIDRGLASDSKARWQTAAAFRAALTPFVAKANSSVVTTSAATSTAPNATGNGETSTSPGGSHAEASLTSPHARRSLSRGTILVAGSAAILLGVSAGAALLMCGGETSPSREPTSAPEATPLDSDSFGAATTGTCQAPQPLVLGATSTGDSRVGASMLSPSCGNDSAPEQVYQLQVQERMQVTVRVDAAFDSVVSVNVGCGAALRELACNDDLDGQRNRSEVSVMLEPGAYHVVVDGFGGQAGPYTIRADGVVPRRAGQCGDGAPTLQPGVDVRGSTAGRPNDFESTCVSSPSGPDFVYRLQVEEPSRVRIRQTAEEDGALHLRSECSLLSEVACNDDFGDATQSVVTAHVDAGTYWVVSDGYDETDGGFYTLRAEVFADSRAAATPDSCASPSPLTTAPARIDTFYSANQLQGSCGGGGGAEQVLAFNLATPARVRVDILESEYDGVYYVRTRCQDSTSEQFCRGFARGVGTDETQGVSPVEHELPAGAYFLILDGTSARGFGAAHLHLVSSPL